MATKINVHSPNVHYTDDGCIISEYEYKTAHVHKEQGRFAVTPVTTKYTFRYDIVTE